MNAIRKHDSKLTAVLAVVLAAIAVVCAMAFTAQEAHADYTKDLKAATPQATTQKTVRVGDFEFTLYYDDGSKTASSIWLSKYYGNATEITVPTSFVYEGKTYPTNNNEIIIGEGAFSGNANIKKVRIPGKYFAIGSNAFRSCPNLTEAAIGDGVSYISPHAFANCPNLRTYYASGANIDSISSNAGIGTDVNGTVYAGVTVYTVAGSEIDKYAKAINAKSSGAKINIVPVTNPYGMSTVTAPDTPVSPYSPGSKEADLEKEITKYSKETDPTGTVFGTLGAKITKVKKNSLTLQWTKASGAKKYVIYGNKCGTKNKMVKLATTTGAKKVFKKVNKKAVKKGTYYKFIVVALDGNGTVVSTSKMVHAVTPGGKYGNHKKVKTAAKKNKATVGVGKTFNLKAKAVPVSKKVKKHRGVAYESSNAGVATVSSKGVITGVKKGTCTVYAYAQNGVCAKIAVTVS